MSQSLKVKIGETIIVFMVLAMGWGVATVSAASLKQMTGTPVNVHDKNERIRGVKVISPEGHQLIKASVTDKNPSSFHINVKKLANINANEDAPTFAVYTSSGLPKQCGDFRKLKMPYKKPSKYEREFDLSKHPEVLKALDRYKCVVMRNIPPKK